MTFVKVCSVTGYLLRRLLEVVVLAAATVVIVAVAIPIGIYSKFRKPSS